MSEKEATAYPENLTQREVEVMRLIALGKSNREIASKLVISPHTVGEYVSKIMVKTGINNRSGLAVYAAQQGFQSCFFELYRRLGVNVVKNPAPSYPSVAPSPLPAYPDGLTQREVEVLRLIALGRSNQGISQELVISLYTVGHNVSNILAKTKVANRAGLAAYATLHGLSSHPAAGWCGISLQQC